MSKSKQQSTVKQQTPIEGTQKQRSQQFHSAVPKIDQSVRPIIDKLQTKIQSRFLQLHNKYLLQTLNRKVHCYHLFIKPPPNPQPSKDHKKQTPLQVQSPIQSQPKATPQQVLEYYKCYDEQISLATMRYQKIHKKSQENKIRLINCVDKCSGNSKGLNEEYQKCLEKCRTSYFDIMTKLYANFYHKFVNQP